MPEAISTQNLVTLPVTSQELGRGGGAFLPPPTKIGLSNNPTTIGLKSSNIEKKTFSTKNDVVLA